MTVIIDKAITTTDEVIVPMGRTGRPDIIINMTGTGTVEISQGNNPKQMVPIQTLTEEGAYEGAIISSHIGAKITANTGEISVSYTMPV